MGTKQIGLESNPVAITTGHLQHRLQASVLKQATNGQAAHAHHRPAAISDVDSMNTSLEKVAHREGIGGIPTPRRHHFSCENLLPRLNGALERRCQTVTRESE